MTHEMAVTVLWACGAIVSLVILVAWLDIANQKRAIRRRHTARIRRSLEPINPTNRDPEHDIREYVRPLSVNPRTAA